MVSTPVREGICQLRDGRRLAYAEWGVMDGDPLLAMHGAPGSRLWCPDLDPGTTTTGSSVRIITVDRPGYGLSDPRPGVRVVDLATDIEQLFDHLRIRRCPVVGVSAGGPYALACAARLPERVSRVGCVSGAAPAFHVAGVWELMSEDWRAVVERAAQDPMTAIDAAREKCRWLAEKPESVADPAGWPEVDRWLAEDASMLEGVIHFVREAGRQGVDGYAWDLLATSVPWGFEPREVEVETWLWHGERDSIVDRVHFDLLCREIPRSHCDLYAGEGHLLRGHWGDVYNALIGKLPA